MGLVAVLFHGIHHVIANLLLLLVCVGGCFGNAVAANGGFCECACGRVSPPPTSLAVDACPFVDRADIILRGA